MHHGELRKYADELVSPKTRRLAIVTGCISGVAGSLAFGPLFLQMPAILTIGAILQRWSPRPGRWLMWLGVFYLTPFVGTFFVPSVLHPPHLYATAPLVAVSLFVASVGLNGWCDVALVVGLLRSKNAPALPDEQFPRWADWMVGVVAICLTTWVVWSALAGLHLIPRHGNWPVLLAFVVSVAAFDTALVAHAIKMHRGRRSSMR
jgi:hypothetical protein